jgi:hypothetical protein
LVRTNCGLGYSGSGFAGFNFSAHGVEIFPGTGFQFGDCADAISDWERHSPIK